MRYHFTFWILAPWCMDFVLRNWMFVTIALLSGAMLLWPLVQRRISPIREVGVTEATRLVNSNDALLLDVRETAEYDGGHLPNAMHIPLSQLAARAADLAKYTSRPVIAYCERGNRSRMAGGALAKAGFADVCSLAGGYRAWKEAGLPVEK
jgi:rhodanese-related sulfurtransferase